MLSRIRNPLILIISSLFQLIEQQVNLSLHRQHLTRLTFFNLLITNPPPAITRLLPLQFQAWWWKTGLAGFFTDIVGW
jgi:hypothetical protein